MHMADALVAPAVAATMYVCSGGVAGFSVKKVRLESDPKKIPVMGVMGAFVFAAQMINFTIPGTGSSGHLCGGMIQCLLFADGGLLALGCNIWNMAFYGCFLGYFLFWRPMMKKGMSRGKIVGASILGCVVTLQLGAFSVALETLASGITDLPFSVFVATMQPIHLVIGLVEGLITAAVLLFVYEARPEMLSCSEERAKSRFSFKKTIAILGIAALVIGGAVSLAASSNPDGLEWSMERLTGSTELENDGTGAHAAAEEIQEKTALLPDYGFKNSDSTFGTSFSGIAGSAVVLIVCVGACYAFRFFKKKKS